MPTLKGCGIAKLVGVIIDYLLLSARASLANQDTDGCIEGR